ncbi:MAG: RNA polymerase sigma factor [Candidatus Colwellbacteria bacterium]|nr:RNA polymerase sigma factor [Candidatus Colwellbacteria bacterium]
MLSNDKKSEFLEAYELYADALYKHCYFRVYEKSRAEELTQETFMRAWQYVSEGKEVKNMRAFLYRVLTNLIIDDSRKRKEQSLDYLIEEVGFNLPDRGDKKAEAGAVLSEIKDKMLRLNKWEREIITLRYLDGLEPKDIAEALDISPNNVSVKLNRAIKKLRKYM